MLVQDHMTRKPITAAEDMSIKDAQILMNTHRVRHLPVVVDGKLVGVVSDRDMKRAAPSLLSGIDQDDYERVMEETPLARIMTRDPLTIEGTTPLVDGLRLLIEKRFGSLLVVEGEALVGIFTEVDALELLLEKLSD